MRRELRIRTQVVLRAKLPGDGSVESWLTVGLARAVAAQQAMLYGVVVRERAVELVDPRDLTEQGFALPTLLGGLTTTRNEHGGVEAVGLCGPMRRRGPKGELPVVASFLEWADCRWWLWEALTRGAEVDVESVTERSAIAGDALPGGIGRYWTWARRSGVRMTLSSGVVH